ncbi:MAG: ABC transporter permease [Clostridia bacterium]|nr:ABC transporter permease [Clostridia bacterium]
MKTALILIRRNIKLFFKDKGMFFTSLITPVILLVLYATFLANVYRDSFIQNFPETVVVSGKILNGLVGGQLLSSLISVTAVTVAFCSNLLMVQDKVSGARLDIDITPVKSSIVSLSYYIATFITTLGICLFALTACLGYIAFIGFYLSFVDIILLISDTVMLVFFGTALSSIVNSFLSTQGQMSAVGSIVSSCYGFIAGAYMPVSSFSSGLRNVVCMLPGTYGTSLLRNHALGGALGELEKLGFNQMHLTSLKDALDCNLYLFGRQIPTFVMYLVLIGVTLLLVGAFVLITYLKNKKIKKSDR